MKIPSIVALFLVATSAAPEKYRYRTTGKSGYAYYYDEAGCGSWPFTSYADVYAFETSYKENASGKPSTTSYPYLYTYFDLWSNCEATTATLTTPNWDSYTESPIINFPGTKLATGSAKASVSAITVPCELVEEEWDGETWSYYNCDYDAATPSTVDLSVSWVASGQQTQSTSSSRSRYNGGFYVYRSKGVSREATVTMSLKAAGKTYNGSPAYGSLEKSTSSDFSMYKY